jgi:hypothetical protein
MSRTFRTTVAVFLTAVATAILVDSALQQFSPLSPLREVRDGIRELEAQNPETVVVGSSHARTFHHLGRVLARQAPDRPPLVAIPLEYGKLTGYEWVLEHRVFPLLDEKDAAGRLRRDHVRRVVLLTEWWDSCASPGSGLADNVPSRAWTFGDYAADVWQHGFTSYNRNYLREQVRHWFDWSVVVQRRGTGRILLDAARAVAGRESMHSPAGYAALVRQWQSMLEDGASCIGDPGQMAALGRMLDGIARRGLEPTVVLFPRNPATFTPVAVASTFERFAAMTRAITEPRGVRVIDLTTSSPLTSDDFMDDFDHVSAEGNERFALWALTHDLAFLKASDGIVAASAGDGRKGTATP